jgi:hypothetical protein
MLATKWSGVLSLAFLTNSFLRGLRMSISSIPESCDGCQEETDTHTEYGGLKYAAVINDMGKV